MMKNHSIGSEERGGGWKTVTGREIIRSCTMASDKYGVYG